MCIKNHKHINALIFDITLLFIGRLEQGMGIPSRRKKRPTQSS